MVSNLQHTPAPNRESIVSSPAPRSNINSGLNSQPLISSSSLNVLGSGSCLRGASNNSTSASNEHLPQIPIKTESQDAMNRIHLENSSSSFNSRLDSGMYEDNGEEKLSMSVVSRANCSPDVMSSGEKNLEDDIRRYSFGDEDIKPPRDLMDESPTSPGGTDRKKRKFSSTEDSKDDRYWERRRKNNMAAKRSRDARRVKENQIAMKATFYERENKILTQELGKARAEIHVLRERLCKYEIV